MQNALVQGIIAAKEETEATDVQGNIGFSAVPDHFGPVVPDFWERIFQLGGRVFVESLDYVGYKFYTEVFEETIDLKDILASIEYVLRCFRGENLKDCPHTRIGSYTDS